MAEIVKDLFISSTRLSIGYIKRIIIEDDTGTLHNIKDLSNDDFDKLLASFGLMIILKSKGEGIQ